MSTALAKNDTLQEESFKNKFVTWWNGQETPQKSEQSHATKMQGGQSVENKLKQVSSNYFNLMERIWGKGFLEPGYIDFNRKIFGLFTLNNNKTVLDIHCGIGGVSQNLSLEYEVWVDAFEENELVREQAFKNIAASKAHSRIKIHPIDYKSNFSFPAEKYHYAYSRDRFFTIENKKDIIAKVQNALKNKGEFTFTDYVLADDTSLSDPDIQKFYETENTPVFLSTKTEYETFITDAKLEMRNTKDYTIEYMEQMLLGWKKIEKELNNKEIKPNLYPYILNEAEIWLQRYNLLEKKKLLYVQILCQKKDE